MPFDIIQERQNFERFAERENWRTARRDMQSDGTGEYLEPMVAAAWLGWKERAKAQL